MAAPKSSSDKVHGRLRKLNGKVVKPVLFNGRAVGGGKYMAGEVDGKLVMIDGTDIPAKLRSIGTLEEFPQQ
jgi:hypothetical protein